MSESDDRGEKKGRCDDKEGNEAREKIVGARSTEKGERHHRRWFEQ